jgi:aconitate hydratase
MAGPKRPQDRVLLENVKASFAESLPSLLKPGASPTAVAQVTLGGQTAPLGHGAVTIASITSCTNTSNPSVLMAAGLLAKKAVAKGLKSKPWVKTSLAPGKVVTRYLQSAGLMPDLEALGFHLVGYGCATCIGNSGPLPEAVAQAVDAQKLVVASVLSGNRNFEGRISPHVRANYLASPPLVVAYAIAGDLNVDLAKDPLGQDQAGNPVYLKDIWPSHEEIAQAMAQHVTAAMFKGEYANVFQGDEAWRSLPVPQGDTFVWDQDSTYVKLPPFFQNLAPNPAVPTDITGARVLAVLGDSVTTDHISPAGNIAKDSPAGQYLMEKGVAPADFNSYGARRGNHEVMMRGTFANARLKNALTPDKEGWWTRYLPTNETTSIYDASMRYQAAGTPLVVLAGVEYGSGSSRDWAAKGPALLGIKAVIAQSYERIHRSNLVGMGVLPLQFDAGESVQTLGLTGEETLDILGIDGSVQPGQRLLVRATTADGSVKAFSVKARIDTPVEVDYHRHGGILPYVLRNLAKS